MKKVILLVEDEASLAKGLLLNLEIEGYAPEWVANGQDARRWLAKSMPDLLVLDLSLPDMNGFQLLQEVKRKDIRQPVLVLTARAGDDDRITGLALGADDYVTKPFNLAELMLRIRGMLKRGAWYREASTGPIRLGQSTVHPERSTLEREGASYLLTERELTLVQHLWRKRGQCVTREELLVEVWGYAPDAQTRTVDIFISRLRKMLGDDADSPRLLRTVRGQGYLLDVEAEAGSSESS
jgi:two-component system alkaline phosphatase synthesis response regulator PhoP